MLTETGTKNETWRKSMVQLKERGVFYNKWLKIDIKNRY